MVAHVVGGPVSIDFPGPPLTDGQIFYATNGVAYSWNAAAGLWLSLGGTSGGVYTSDVPPPTPYDGQLWFNSAIAQLMIRFNDGSSTQWIPCAQGIPGAPLSQATAGMRVLSSVTVSNQPYVDLTGIPSDINHLDLWASFKVSIGSQQINMQVIDSTGVRSDAAYYSLHIWNTTGTPSAPSGGWYTAVAAGYRLGDDVSVNCPFLLRANFMGIQASTLGLIEVDCLATIGCQQTSSVPRVIRCIYGMFTIATNVTGLRIYPSSGNITSGRFTLLGLQ